MIPDLTSSARKGSETARREVLDRWLPAALAATVLVVYLPSLPGGYLNWDDPWLIENNPLLNHPTFSSLVAIWSDFSVRTRLALGAEYLPVRDTSLWLESALFGLHPQALRITNLGLYVAAISLVRLTLLRIIPHRGAAELASWWFALHPVHVESVAWLAGRKDVLSLLFVGAALWVHARGTPRPRAVVPALLLVSHLSKSLTVVAAGLLLAQDLLLRRRPDARLYAACLAVAGAVLAIDVEVGRSVSMVGEPAGGSRLAALITMGPVWTRYLGLLVWPPGLSLVQDVAIRTSWDPPSVLGYAIVLFWASAGIFLWRRRSEPLLLASWLWFFVPLLPVSQVLFPLQNRMADRYLLFSVLAPALLFALATRRWPRPATIIVTLSITALVPFTAARAALFADSASVFADATLKTKRSPVAPYQLGQALEQRGDRGGARLAYAEVLRRAPEPNEVARRATSNLSKLLAKDGKLGEAEQLLRRAVRVWPRDPKIVGNLAEVLARQGRHPEARRLFQRVMAEHPKYEVGRQAYERWYGETRLENAGRD